MANTCTTEICLKLIELMSKGRTQDQVCAELCIHPDTFIEWRKEAGPHYEKDFAEAYKSAKVLQKAWWDGYGIGHMEDKCFQAGLYNLFRVNMKHWKPASRGRENELMEEIRELKRHLGIGDDE